MKALVIGAAGFVGDYLIDDIQRTMACDIVATKLPGETMDRRDIDMRDLNVLDEAAVQSLLRETRPAYIFYLAAQSSVALAWQKPGLTMEVNIMGSLNTVNAIRALTAQPRTLIVGSGEEYGRVQADQLPIREDAALRPGNIYAVTKACQNMMATVYSHAYNMPLIMVRAFNHIGPKQRETFVVADFCRQVAEIEAGNREATIQVGNLEARRDFTDVRDVVSAYTRLIRQGRAGETYNVGTGRAVSIAEVLEMILSYSHAKIDVRVDPERFRPIDVPVIEPSIEKLRRDTGWRPGISLQQSIVDILAYWRAVIADGARRE